MKNFFIYLIVYFLLFQTTISYASELTCNSFDGVNSAQDTFNSKAKSNIIIGESHGYNKSSIIAAKIVCQSLKNNYKTSLGFELSYTMNLKLQEYFYSDGLESDKEQFLSDPIWSNPLDDGRHTLAILDLIEFSRQLRQTGAEITVYTFQASNTKFTDAVEGQSFNELYEEVLYKNILEQTSARNSDKNIVLVGNVHARVGTASYGGNEYKTMASYFPRDSLITLNYKEIPKKDGTIEIFKTPKNGYDGAYYVDILTKSSSPPSNWLF